MTGTFEGLLARITAPGAPGAFNVVQVPGRSAFYVGRDAQGSAVLLIRTTGPGPRVPVQLAGIEARFGMPCQVAEDGGHERIENLTAVVCSSRAPGIETYFISTMELLSSILGEAPTLTAVAEAVDRLVDLFQRLRRPARKATVGVIGELLVIRAASDTELAVRAWRADPDERYDFSSGNLRVEAKATSGRRRVHDLSFEQANPPPGSIGLLASVLVSQSAGGSSLGSLVEELEARLTKHDVVLKLRSVIADTLGQDLPAALGWSFDLHHAIASIRLYDLNALPAIRPPLPKDISSVRFTVNIDGCQSLNPRKIGGLSADSHGLLPRDSRRPVRSQTDGA